MDVKYYLYHFARLHTARYKGKAAPHKAVLLLAVINLVERGSISSPVVELSDELVNEFKSLWKEKLPPSCPFTCDISKPYLHMQHEPFWKLVEKYDIEAMLVAEDEPWSKDKKEKKNLPNGSYTIKSIRNAFEFAEIDYTLFQLLQNADARAMLRVVLINEYLVNQPTKTIPNITQLIMVLPFIALVA